jgi:phosphoribosylaminoimidazolecarboxamide formyltransferase / IMP cyclohydrolase
MAEREWLQLRYGTNPQQRTALARPADGVTLPIRALVGRPTAINLWNALVGWELVRELREAFGVEAAASIKHLSPVGAALAADVSGRNKLATAYARARGADRVAAFGDCAAFSDPVDVSAADLLATEPSDAVVAPGYEPEALEILRGKSDGRFVAFEVDAAFVPPAIQRRDLFGVAVEQPRDSMEITVELLRDTVVTEERHLGDELARDLLLATIAARLAQSNAAAVALDGQLVGVGCGAQSRGECVRAALRKAQLWHLRRHPAVRSLPFHDEVGGPDRDYAIDLYIRGEHPRSLFTREPELLDSKARDEWLEQLDELALSSDGLLRFRDVVDSAAAAGVRAIAQPGGSAREGDVVAAANEHGIVMSCHRVRLFMH